jgi:hypothetical protein
VLGATFTTRVKGLGTNTRSQWGSPLDTFRLTLKHAYAHNRFNDRASVAPAQDRKVLSGLNRSVQKLHYSLKKNKFFFKVYALIRAYIRNGPVMQ